MPILPPVPADPTTAAQCIQVAGLGASLVTLHLFANNVVPSPPNQPTDFTEPTIPEGAAVAGGDWLGPFVMPDGTPYFQSPVRRFIVPQGSASDQFVYGAWLSIVSGGVTAVIEAERFDAPVELKAGKTALSLAPVLYIAPLAPPMMHDRRGITPGLTALLAAQCKRVANARFANRMTWRGLRRAKLQHLVTMLNRALNNDSREVVASDAQGRTAYLFDSTPDVDYFVSQVQIYAQAALAARGMSA